MDTIMSLFLYAIGIVWIMSHSVVVDGRLLNARDHSIGKWILEIRTQHHRSTGVKNNAISNKKDVVMQLFGIDAVDSIASEKRFFGGEKIKCDLHLKSDGTFILKPHSIIDKKAIEQEENGSGESKSDEDHSYSDDANLNFGTLMESMGGDDDAAFQTKLIQTNGRWKVRQNPYCVTDRHYDEILFSVSPSSSQDLNKNEKSLYSRMDFRCKLWGRFGSHHAKGMFKPGRMTHGRITGTLRSTKQQKQKTSARRDIIATFRAIPESQFR